MSRAVDKTVDLLEALVSFQSVSARSNLDLIDYVRRYLEDFGVTSQLSHDDSGSKANLFATIGPAVDGGVVLSGHSDVVPVDGQDWQSDPFVMRRGNGRLYGRGTADMKGFIACVLAEVPRFVEAPLGKPLHIALTFDEEIGSCGAPILVHQMKGCSFRPRITIVGEPTGMKVIAGHKGGYELTTTVTGMAGHASEPAKGVNAIAYAARFIARLEEVARDLAAGPADPDDRFDPPFSTISVGTIHGGTARNVIAGGCLFDWELRPVPRDDPEAILAAIDRFAQENLLPEMQQVCPEAAIDTVLEASYPGLAFDADSEAVRLIRQLTGQNAVEAVSFGSDAGHFQGAGLSTVLFGPGSIDQAHKPDEFIEVGQLKACHGFLDRLRDWLIEQRD